jgi:hypothetical protein
MIRLHHFVPQGWPEPRMTSASEMTVTVARGN